MKLVILCLCIAFAACMPRDRDQSQAHNHDHHDDHDVAIPMSKVYGKARKVPGSSGSSFGRGGSGTTSEMCPVTCMRQMKVDIENDPQFSEFIEKQSKPYRFDNQFDIRMLNKYCQKMNRTVDCVRPCTEGQLKNMATKALSLPRYMCVESKFTEYAPCYNKVGKQMEKVCHAANKCGPKKTALENDMRKQPSTMADIENMLKHTCDYMACYTECDRPKVVQECGADANRVLEGLYKKSIDVMREIFSTMGISIQMPAQCNRIGGGGLGVDDEDDEDEDVGFGANRGSRPSNRDRDTDDEELGVGQGTRSPQTGGRGGGRGGNQGSGRSGSSRGGNQGTNRGTQSGRGGTRRGSDRDQDEDTDEN
jgi:hypothetical protein